MKIQILFILVLIHFSSFSQINQEIEDQKHEQIILIGEINKQGLLMDEYKEWFVHEYDAYEVDSITLIELSKEIKKSKELEIIIFLATWCSDSREQVPRFYKILDQLDIDVKLTVYALDEFKECPDADVPSYKIERVPTIIFYKSDKKIGRIIETPDASLEKDLLEILKIENK